MFPNLKLPKFEISPIKKFLYTFRKTLSIAYKVSPSLLFLVIISNSIWGLTNLPILYINKTLIDVVINSLGKPDLNYSLKVIAILAFSRAFLEFIRSSLSGFNWSISNTLAEKIQAYLELVSGLKLNTLDVSTVESPDFQDKFKKIEREGKGRVYGMINPLSDIPNAIFTIISGVIPIFSFKPLLALVVIAVSLPDIFISSKIVKKDYEEGQILDPKWRLWGWISWHLTDPKNFYENRILNGTKYLLNKLSGVQNEVIDYRYKRRINRARLRFLGSIPGFLLSAALNIYFFVLAIIGKITLGSAQLLYGATSTLTNGFGTLINDSLSIYENYLFVSDLTWFLDLSPKFSRGKSNLSGVFSKGIDFKNVWFKYPNSDTWVLKGVNFSINPKENIAIVGENGAGKTTLIKLLCGFYKPSKGEILVNGRNIFDYNPDKYWSTLGVLFQDFSEYPFTARESMGLGDVKKVNKLKDIKKAAKLTGVDSFIESLPLGYENPLNKEFDKGISPSKGQWQRIALARIFLRDSKIIALDEPTSNVDPKAEEEIFEKIIKLAKEKILILISHRFSTVRRADKILLLENGKVMEEGTHAELMKQNGEYAHLFELQAKGYK